MGGVRRVDVVVGLALLETCFGDGKEKGALVVVLLAVCASWGVFVGKDVAPMYVGKEKLAGYYELLVTGYELQEDEDEENKEEEST